MSRPTLLEILPPFCFGLGAIVATVNCYLSFLQYPIHRLCGGTKENYRPVSGFPLIGTPLLIVAAIAYWETPLMAWIAIAFAVIDTGGIHFALAAISRDRD